MKWIAVSQSIIYKTTRGIDSLLFSLERNYYYEYDFIRRQVVGHAGGAEPHM